MKEKSALLLLLLFSFIIGCNNEPTMESSEIITIYPSPAIDAVRISFSDRPHSGALEVADPTGEVFFTATIPQGDSEMRVNLHGKSNGKYFVTYSTTGLIAHENFLKQ